MERSEILAAMAKLKLNGMKAAYDEIPPRLLLPKTTPINPRTLVTNEGRPAGHGTLDAVEDIFARLVVGGGKPCRRPVRSSARR